MNADTVAHECAHLLKFLLRLSKRNDKGLHPVTPVSYILRLHLPAIAIARRAVHFLQVSLSAPSPPFSTTTNASKRWSR